ncbi:MAG: tetratricopeptide repeat protein [Alphaproteobacteria bacterium]
MSGKAGGPDAARQQAASLFAAAVAAHRDGRRDEAATLYRRVLALAPGQPSALLHLGILAAEAGDIAEATTLIGEAATGAPGDANVQSALGTLRARGGDLAGAVAAFRAALAIQPGAAEVRRNLAQALLDLGHAAEAVAEWRRVCATLPGDGAACAALGRALLAAGDPAGAEGALRDSLARGAGGADVHNALGSALWQQGRIVDAEAAFAAAAAAAPADATAHANRAGMLREQVRLDEAIVAYRTAVALAPAVPSHTSNLLLAMQYLPAATAESLGLEHRTRAAALWPPAARPAPADPDPARRLRIGYVSGDFRDHSVAWFLAPVLAAHDRTAVEVAAYASVAQPDAMTARLAGTVARWRDIARLDDEAAAAQVRADAIDILVDLSGHTAGGRPGLFARRPAPVAVTWLGYPDTTGLAAIDARIVDAVTDPPDAPWHGSEAPLRLPGFLCYGPPADAPDVAPPPMATAGAPVFGSFNDLAKLNDAVVALWARLLARVPAARLLLKAWGLGDPAVAAATRARFAAHGIAAERILTLARVPGTRAHLDQYARIDVALDPFSYNGTTTTCEALWMGVPVVTLAGARHAARVGASLLSRLGRPQWIAADEDAYVAIAAGLAADPRRLAAIRARLRPAMADAPLTAAGAFTRQLEAAYRALWRAACTGTEARP